MCHEVESIGGHVLPAYAGMIPEAPVAWDAKASAPRVCGDDPFAIGGTGIAQGVLPAYAGMILRPWMSKALQRLCSPRMRG